MMVLNKFQMLGLAWFTTETTRSEYVMIIEWKLIICLEIRPFTEKNSTLPLFWKFKELTVNLSWFWGKKLSNKAPVLLFITQLVTLLFRIAIVPVKKHSPSSCMLFRLRNQPDQGIHMGQQLNLLLGHGRLFRLLNYTLSQSCINTYVESSLDIGNFLRWLVSQRIVII